LDLDRHAAAQRGHADGGTRAAAGSLTETAGWRPARPDRSCRPPGAAAPARGPGPSRVAQHSWLLPGDQKISDHGGEHDRAADGGMQTARWRRITTIMAEIRIVIRRASKSPNRRPEPIAAPTLSATPRSATPLAASVVQRSRSPVQAQARPAAMNGAVAL